MPPQRDFSSKVDYMQRNLHDDLLEQLKNSTNDMVRGCELIPKNPRMLVGEGLYNQSNLLRDMDTTMGGMDLFKRCFSQRKKGPPLSNVWEFDVGKLVIPTIFLDVNLLVSLAKRYDPLTRVVSNFARDKLFAMTAPVIREVFSLTSNSALLERIDLSEL